jgi:hypothetical protein
MNRVDQRSGELRANGLNADRRLIMLVNWAQT